MTFRIIKYQKIIIIGIALLFANYAYCQQDTLKQLLTDKQYSAFLQQSQPMITAIVQQPDACFDQVTALAIALEKTKGWAGDDGKRIQAGLKTSPDALLYLDITKKLLKEDTQSIDRLFEGKAPEAMSLIRTERLLREHGFTLAANVIGPFSPDLPGKRILNLVSIPKDKRVAVEKVFLLQVKDPPNRMLLARTALDMFLHPPANITVDPKEFYDFALKIGQGTNIVSFDTAQQLLQGGKKAEALQMVEQIAMAQPTDVITQLRVARFLRNMGEQSAANDCYQQALVNVPEPWRREVRLDYLEYLQWQKKDGAIAVFQVGKDMLFAGDAALVTAHYDEATAFYSTIITSQTAPVEKRLAAWAGLLDADPGQALVLGKSLVPAIEKANPLIRPMLVVWMGRQFWSVMSREVPAKPGSFVMGWRKHFRPVHEVKEWEIPAAALATQLLDSDLEACLRPDTRYTPDSFRYPAVMLFALSGDARKAAEILSKSLDYQIPPPPGGWKIFDGSPTPDTNKPRTRTTPTPIELKKLTMLVLEDISRCPKANEHVPALSAIIAKNIAEQLAKDTKDEDIRLHLQELASVVKFTVTALDPLPQPLRTDLPPPPAHKVDMTCFAPIDTVIRKVLTSDNVAKNGLLLVNEGLRDALLTASNPELLTTLTDLSSYTIQRYGEVCKQPKFAVDERKNLTNYLAARPVNDMQQYINRLNGGFVRGVNE